MLRSRETNTTLNYENIHLWTEILKDILKVSYGLEFEMNHEADIVTLNNPYEEHFAQFCFHFCNAKQGIYVDRLTVPLQLRGKGIGTFCVKWLKDFASNFRFRYIVLGSVAEARAFWIKMGFRLLTPKELYAFPGYQGRYNR